LAPWTTQRIEQKLRENLPILDDWQQWGATAFRSTQGSELEVDDQDWPSIPVSEIAARVREIDLRGSADATSSPLAAALAG